MRKTKGTGKIKGLYLQEAYWNVLEKYASKIDRPTNWVITNIIDNWITRNKKLLKIKA